MVKFVCTLTDFELDSIDDTSYDVSEGLIAIAILETEFEPEICARPVTYTYSIDGGISTIDNIVQLNADEL